MLGSGGTLAARTEPPQRCPRGQGTQEPEHAQGAEMSNETVENETAELASRMPGGACSVEIFRRGVPGNVNIWYWVAEVHPTADIPYPDPVDIISWDETYYVIVYITLDDAVRRHLCGKLCVDI